MRKLITLLFILLIFTSISLNSECICFYYNDMGQIIKNLTYNSCRYYGKVINQIFKEECEFEDIKNFTFNKEYDKIIFSGFGTYNGFMLEYNYDKLYDTKKYTENKVIKWKDIAGCKLKANLVIIDACYSGFIHDFERCPDNKNIITSSYKENSWNIMDKYGNVVGSLPAALRCIYDKDYDCPINCSKFNNDVNTCQLNLILWSIREVWKDDTIMFPWEYPSMGTCVINGRICKDFK